jgi:hypothetical protein
MVSKVQVLAETHAIGRIEELGLDDARLREAIEWAVAHVRRVTRHEPPSAGGVTLYNKLTGRLRDLYVPRGWDADDTANHCKLVNPKTGIAVVVASGDNFTGTEGAHRPSTRSAKGRRTREAIGQMVMDFDGHTPVPALGLGQQMWVLLVYVGDHEVRWELGLPAAVGRSGHIDNWIDELIGTPISLEDTVLIEAEEPTPAIDIEIRRKAE